MTVAFIMAGAAPNARCGSLGCGPRPGRRRAAARMEWLQLSEVMFAFVQCEPIYPAGMVRRVQEGSERRFW